MKKIIVSLFLVFVAVAAGAQTFPVNNLVVNGTSQFTGQGNFTLSPTAPTATAGDSSTKLATTAFVGTAVSTGLSGTTPVAATNAALQALPTTSTSQIWRIGFTTSGDAPPLLYTASGSPCSLNAGAGDNGSQVKSSNNLCWIASLGPGSADVREWGAIGNGSTNNTVAMQAAHNTGRLIYYPQGTYSFTNLTMTAGGIVGDGESLTQLQSTDISTANIITYSAVNIIPGQFAPVFKSFALIGNISGGKTVGAGLFVTAPSSENQGGQFYAVMIYNCPTSLAFGAASNWVVQNSKFINYIAAGIVVNNTNTADSGDSLITGSLINTSLSSGTAYAINYQSSGGLKILGNKLNGGKFGIFVGLTATASTSDLLITGNSIENETTANISLSRVSGSAQFLNTVITGNQLALSPFGIVVDNSGAFSVLTITGNTISITPAGTAGISIASAGILIIGENALTASGGTPTGIIIGAGSSNGTISPNIYNGFSTNIANASGSVQVVIVP